MHLATDITGLSFKHRTGIGRILEELLVRWIAQMEAGRSLITRMTLLSAVPPTSEWSKRAEESRNVALRFSHSPSHYVWRQTSLGRMARRCGADLLYVHEPIAPLVCSVPLVCTVNDFFFRDIPENEPWHILWIYRLIAPPTIRRSAALACISRHTLDRLTHYFPAARLKARLIYPGCGFARFQENEKTCAIRDDLRRRHALPTAFALFAGVATLRKNIARIFEALARLRDEGFHLPLVIFGPPSPYAQECARRWNIAPIHTGYLSDEEIAALYRMAAVLVFPSISEGFGFPIVEAMAAGTPVVTASTTATGEIAGDAAHLVNPFSVEEIAAGVRKCVEDTAYASELVRRGRERALLFDWDRAAAQMVDLFGEALRGTILSHE